MLPVNVWCFCQCSWGRWHSCQGCICSCLDTVHCQQSWHRQWEPSPAPERCHYEQNRQWFWAVKSELKANFLMEPWRSLKVTNDPTYEPLSPLLDWAWCSWHPCPSCWPAGLPRPLSCGCNSLEEFLPRGSSKTHLLLERGKAYGDRNFAWLMISNYSQCRIFSLRVSGFLHRASNLHDTLQAILPSGDV